MNLLNRNLKVILNKNLGNGLEGELLDISENIESIDDHGWSLDSDLHNISIDSLNMTIIDNTATIWTWLQNNIQLENGSLYPPKIRVSLGDSPVFYGIIRPQNISRNMTNAEQTISITAQDWSAELANLELDSSFWIRPNPLVNIPRTSAAGIPVLSSTKKLLFQIYNNQFQMFSDGATKAYCSTTDGDLLQIGDTINLTITNLYSNIGVLSIKRIPITNWPEDVQLPFKSAFGLTITEVSELTLENFLWPDPGGDYADYDNTELASSRYSGVITRPSSSISEQLYYITTAAISKDDETTYIPLDTVVGLSVGDSLKLLRKGTIDTGYIQSEIGTITILDIDTESNYIISTETISFDIPVASQLFFTEDTLNTLVFESYRSIISKANSLGPTSFDNFQLPTLPLPALSYLPFQVRYPSTANKSIILAPSEIQTTIDGLQIKGFRTAPGVWKCYEGSPELGWTDTESSFYPTVNWTDKQLTPPSFVMPDESRIYAPNNWRRNKTQSVISIKSVDNETEDVYDPELNWRPDVILVHDYSIQRRYIIRNTQQTIQAQTYNGSVFISTGIYDLTSYLSAVPTDVVEFSQVSGSLGGRALLAICDDDTIKTFLDSDPKSLDISALGFKNCYLKNTAYGTTYLLTARGYGKVTVESGALKLKYMPLDDTKSLNMLPSTFCALDENTLYALGATQYFDPEANTDTPALIRETWLLEMISSPSPVLSTSPILRLDKVFNGVPKLTQLLKDPTSERLIGAAGGRLFQICRTVSDTIERYSAEGLNAKTLIENCGVILNTFAVAAPDGVLYITSRQKEHAVVDLTVDVLEQSEIRVSENWYSTFTLTGNTDDISSSYISAEKGGDTNEIAGHPFIVTQSQARAVVSLLGSFFGLKRQQLEQTWSYSNSSVLSPAAPWEGLAHFQRVRINGSSQIWYLIEIESSLSEFQAKVKLLEYR